MGRTETLDPLSQQVEEAFRAFAFGSSDPAVREQNRIRYEGLLARYRREKGYDRDNGAHA
ncbi:hypothetical protein [Desertimonas flava]|uniref:hypothetical protein n=1 Tax=Desertimonas flava TaxID=2064846 RepID=UPI000E349C95|nr:hypothetical protein [Desertimonas flava]